MNQATHNSTDAVSPVSTTKRLLVVCRTAPYGSSLARESLETALAAGAMGINVAMLFIDEGVWQLIDNRDAHHKGHTETGKSHSATISALPIYDVGPLLADKESLSQRGIDLGRLADDAEIIETVQVINILNSYEIVLSF